MIVYDPLVGDPIEGPVTWRPRTCFVMTKLGKEAPDIVGQIRRDIKSVFDENNVAMVDADAVTTGRDFLRKIWGLIVPVPVAIAIVYDSMRAPTMGNVFYELGLAHALGKETLVVKTPRASIPSDFARTEYVEYREDFGDKLRAYVDNLWERAVYYQTLAESFEKANPLLAIDYYRRAYLLTGEDEPRLRARVVLEQMRLTGRLKAGLGLLVGFCGEDAR